METDYIPIDCDEHDKLLALASLRQPMQCTALDQDGHESAHAGIIDDVYTKAGAEYLHLRDGPTLRLDRILTLDGRPFGAACFTLPKVNG